jgi:hypothetical protein
VADTKKSFALRVDRALYAAVARLASADLRSVNAEIEVLLREALKARGVNLEPPPADDPSDAEQA